MLPAPPTPDNDGPAAELTPHELLGVIRYAGDNTARSLQKEIGPSQVGAPCTRRLALQLLDAPQHNTTADKWAATVGTAVHAWLADAFTADNARLVAAGGSPRWLVEQRVTIRPGLSGNTDLYDLRTHTVVDHKTVGVKNLRKYRAAGDPGQQYRHQGHLYGKGWANLGLPVRNVAVIFYPRSGLLRDTWMWTEPYNPAVADAALARMDDVLTGMNTADHAGLLDDYVGALDQDAEHCDWCPYFTTDPAVPAAAGCTGGPDSAATERQTVPGIA